MPDVPFATYRTYICLISLSQQTWVLFKELLCLILAFVCNLLPPMSFALTSPMARRGLKALVRLLYLLLVHVIKSIKCVSIYSTFYILPIIRRNGLRCRIGHNECPLPTIRANSESPTTFRRMFKAPFWSALMTFPMEERNNPLLTLRPRYSSCLPIGSRVRASHLLV